MIRRLLALCALAALVAPQGRAEDSQIPSVEQRLVTLTQSKAVTIVHLWAPWCPNCRAELSGGGWSAFLGANPGVNVVFVTVWNPTDGREVLAKYGVGAQPNFQLLLHPNGSRARGEKVSQLLGLPISWIPTTWVYRDGKLRYALNYGELRFPILEQLVKDSSDTWEH